MSRRQGPPERIALLKQFFVREDVYGLETLDAKIGTCRAHLGQGLLEAHLRGEIRIGAHTIGFEGTVMWGCIDVDDDHLPAGVTDEEAVRRVQRALQAAEVPPLVERSKSRGFHMWMFLRSPVPAWKIRGLLRAVVADAGLPDVECFPKQDFLDDTENGLGNFVWLPWHGGSVRQGRTLFMDIAVGGWPPLADQAQALVSHPRLDVAVVDTFLETRGIRQPPRRDASARVRSAGSREPSAVSLEALRVSRPIQQLIVSGWAEGGPYPSRSELDMAVILALLGAGHSSDEIRAVFTSPVWRIGEKYREPDAGDRYLDHSIANARGRLAEGNGQGALAQDPPSPPQADPQMEDRRGTRSRRATQAEQLVSLASEAALFHVPDGDVGFATIQVNGHQETWRLRSTGFRQWLQFQFYRAERRPPAREAVAAAVAVLEAKAKYDGPAYPVSVRLAEVDGNIYLDLVNEAWEAVEITPTGWRVVSAPPVKFLRVRGMLALPAPVRGGELAELAEFVNVGSERDWRLLVGWLLAALRPSGPFPVAVLHGEQGSAKSTTARVMRMLVDPNLAPLRSEPKDERDVMIAATHGWCLAFDNLSRLAPWFSDAICRLATGGGFGTRELYTDEDEVLFDAQRPVLLNGIEELATRGDLLDRALLFDLPAIPDDLRQTEKNFRQAFEAARPRILGALLNAVSIGLRTLPTLRLPPLPRMADFAAWVSACEPALRWPSGSFMAAYMGNREASHELALDASPLAGPVRQLAEESGEPGWGGTCTELLDWLNQVTDENTRLSRQWPKAPHVLSNGLRRLVPNLRAVGVGVTFWREPQTGKRLVQVRRIEDFPRTIVPDGMPPNPVEHPGGAAADAVGSPGRARPSRDSAFTQPGATHPEVHRDHASTRNHTGRDGRDDGDARTPPRRTMGRKRIDESDHPSN